MNDNPRNWRRDEDRPVHLRERFFIAVRWPEPAEDPPVEPHEPWARLRSRLQERRDRDA